MLAVRATIAVEWIKGKGLRSGNKARKARAKALRGSSTRISDQGPVALKEGKTSKQPALRESRGFVRLLIRDKREIRSRRLLERICAANQKPSISFSLAGTEFGDLSDGEAEACHILNMMSVDASAYVAPTARVHPDAVIGPGTQIGEFCVIEQDVVIGARCLLEPYVYVKRWTSMGEENQISAGTALGTDPLDKSFTGERSYLFIGDRNKIREHYTISRGSQPESEHQNWQR